MTDQGLGLGQLAVGVVAVVALAACTAAPRATEPAAPAVASAATAPAAAEPAGPALTAEQVLQAYVDATGGRAAYERLTSRIVTGTLALPAAGLQGPLMMYQEDPRRLLLVASIEGLGKIERGTDGELAWERNPLMGARIFTGQEKSQALRDATFNAEIKTQELYSQVELAGTATEQGRPVYRILLTAPDGTTSTHCYDRETHLELRFDQAIQTHMGELPSVTVLSDYRETGGIRMPFKLITRALGQDQVITIEKVEHNVAIPPEVFALPEEIKQLAAQPAPD